jgi:hypothetical protein
MKNYLLLIIALACLGCVPSNQLNRLYFGMNKPSGGTVSEQEFGLFLEQEVSPRFPEGLTLFAAKGQWRNGKGRIEQENSRVVEIVCDDTQENHDKVAAIAAKYKTLFAQEAVMVIQSQSDVTFH